jgi:hypothetical protein
MKRYTAQVRLHDSSLGPQQIKAGIERAFLYRRLPSVYRLGTVTQTDSNTVQIEIASELERDELEQSLSSLETKLAIQVQRVGWGWSLTSTDKQVTGLVNDPFASVEAQQDASGTFTYSRWQIVRYIASIGLDVFLLLLVGLLIVGAPVREFLNGQNRTLGLLNLCCIPVYFSMMLGVRIIPLPYVAFIRCSLDGMEIKYGWLTRSQQLKWSEILELKKDYTVYTIRSSRRSLKFPTGEVVPLKQESILIKTILERASLFFVGDSGRSLVYKRSDAT